MRQQFIDWTPTRRSSAALLSATVEVAEDFAAQGYQVTLRQLYYQLVRRNLVENTQKAYKRLGEIVTKGRLAGFIDWDTIVDHLRVPEMPPDWSDPSGLMRAAIANYRLPRWNDQPYQVEVWCEKAALSSVLEPVCRRHHVRFLACRGYASSTAVYEAAKRFKNVGKVRILYLGDHDPSGLDMTRDINERLLLLTEGRVPFKVERLALNWEQVQQYRLPPNPAKLTDSRAKQYIQQYGRESWELDALEPAVLDRLVDSRIDQLRDRDLYWSQLQQEDHDRELLQDVTAEVMERRAEQGE